jgi:hypothetical protein
MVPLYDSFTPEPHWSQSVIDFESVCDTDQFDVKIWNMNIPWTESPAGLNSSTYQDYTKFGSINYIGQNTDNNYYDNCSCNPKNGGSGVCNCIMSSPKIS